MSIQLCLWCYGKHSTMEHKMEPTQWEENMLPKKLYCRRANKFRELDPVWGMALGFIIGSLTWVALGLAVFHYAFKH
jgi:hypothetical protein